MLPTQEFYKRYLPSEMIFPGVNKFLPEELLKRFSAELRS